MSAYEKELEKQNEELRTMLAAAQQELVNLPKNIFVFGEIYGYTNGTLETINNILVNGTERLKKLIDKRKEQSKMQNTRDSRHLGYSIEQPHRYYFRRHVHHLTSNNNYYFDYNFGLVEGWVFNTDTHGWDITDSGNEAVINVQFLHDIGVWEFGVY